MLFRSFLHILLPPDKVNWEPQALVFASHRILRFLILLLGKIIYKLLFLRYDREKTRRRHAKYCCKPCKTRWHETKDNKNEEATFLVGEVDHAADFC